MATANKKAAQAEATAVATMSDKDLLNAMASEGNLGSPATEKSAGTDALVTEADRKKYEAFCKLLAIRLKPGKDSHDVTENRVRFKISGSVVNVYVDLVPNRAQLRGITVYPSHFGSAWAAPQLNRVPVVIPEEGKKTDLAIIEELLQCSTKYQANKILGLVKTKEERDAQESVMAQLYADLGMEAPVQTTLQMDVPDEAEVAKAIEAPAKKDASEKDVGF